MKSVIRFFAIGLCNLCLVTFVQAQTSPSATAKASTATTTSTTTTATTTTSSDKSGVAGATNSARTDVYHVHFAHAAPGKSADLGEALKTPGPNGPAADHILVLRHQQGDAWDYAVIAHSGPKFTVEAARPQVPAAQRDLGDWHDDTLVNGPPWADFVRAMGLGDDASKTSGSAYVVSVFRAVPGHREQLEKLLGEPANAANDKAVGSVLMQHLEGSPWQYLSVVRYSSWQDFATTETNNAAQASKKDSGWSQTRNHVAHHSDTMCSRAAP